MVICQDLKSKRADNVLSFYLAFMMACEGDETHLLWEQFFNWILNVSERENRMRYGRKKTNIQSILLVQHKNMQTHVRIRMCQFIEQFLGAMNMNAVLDANICEGIERYMILNADDFSNLVRSVALNGLQRLQDPTNPTAATWKHYLFHLNDPAPNVRKSVISSICKNRFSIPKLLEHLMDKVDAVRIHLVQSLANVSYKHYKTEDRIKLLEDGLSRQPHGVVSGIQDTILMSWFAEMDRNYVKFTKNLVLETSWKEFQRSVLVAKRALKYLFSVDGAYLQYLESQLAKTGNELMDSICDSVERSMVLDGSTATLPNTSATVALESCIDMNRLTPEMAIYWSAALEYYQEQNEDDAIFPELSQYLKYVEAFGRRSAKMGGELKQKRRFQYVFGLLVDNLHLYDFKDECCRTFLKETSSRLILSSHIKKDTLRALIRIHSEVYPEESQYLNSICSVIHEELTAAADQTVGNTSRRIDQEVRIKHYLKVIYLLMVNRRTRTLTPLLTDLFESVILPRIENGDRKIRIWSTKCTATYAVLDATMAQTFYYKLIAQLQVQHNVPVWAVIIESIFDLLARYGIEFLSGGGGDKNGHATSARESRTGGDDESPAVGSQTRNGRALYNTTSECWGAQLDESIEQVNILEVLQALYDDCSDLLIVRPIVLGFCRLVLTEQCQSVELMMKLLVTFFTTDTYPELVQILGAFFVELCENQLQDLLVMSLLPTLEYMAANPNLPVDMDSVVQFVVDSTSPKSSDSNQFHLKLAHLFVETIHANDKHKTLVKIMFKYLNQLDISHDAIDSTELERMCTSLAKCDHLKPDQVETVRRKLSGVRKEGSTMGGCATDLSTNSSTSTAINATSPDVNVESQLEVVVEEEEAEEAQNDIGMSQSQSEGTDENTTIPETPQATTHTAAAVSLSSVTLAEGNTTAVPPPMEQEDEDGPETDCSMSSFKENKSVKPRSERQPATRSTAIPRLISTGNKVTSEPCLRLRRPTGVKSKIPIVSHGPTVQSNEPPLQNTSNKRTLDRSLTMTPNVKQKRADSDPNVRKRQLSERNGLSVESVQVTPTKAKAPTKSTSTPINHSVLVRESRVVLSPMDMSSINKTRPTTRSVTVHSKRPVRSRNTNK